MVWCIQKNQINHQFSENKNISYSFSSKILFNRHKEIIPAASWLTLKEFGGFLTIGEFRKNFDTNSSEFILLQPPLISRQMQIEESYKKSSSNGPINKLDKLFADDITSYSLKRSKPVETSQLNLEKTK